MLQMRREIARFQETRAIIQGMRDEDGDAAKKSFEDYRNALMPFLADEDKRREKALVQQLQSEVGRGGMQVRPLTSATTVVSQLKRQVNTKGPRPPSSWKRLRKW